jgi:hypothetical protein
LFYALRKKVLRFGYNVEEKPFTSPLKGQCHEIFSSDFFFISHLPPSPLNNIRVIKIFEFADIFTSEGALPVETTPVVPFRIFSKIRGHIRSSRCTTGIKTPAANIATGTAGVDDTGGAP